MATISISLPDELVHYLEQKVGDKNLLITSILQQWQRQQEDQELAQACSIIDELELGWTEEWQTASKNKFRTILRRFSDQANYQKL